MNFTESIITRKPKNTSQKKLMKKKVMSNVDDSIPMPAYASGHPYEYKMPKDMAKFYIKQKPVNMKPMEFLCEVVTKEFGLLGWCCKVIIEG